MNMNMNMKYSSPICDEDTCKSCTKHMQGRCASVKTYFCNALPQQCRIRKVCFTEFMGELEREASSSDYEPNLSQLSRLELSTPPSSPELRNGSPPAPTSPRPASPSSPKHRMLQDSARRPSVGRLLVNDCPVPGDSDADNAPPKTGLDLPLIWTTPTLPVHDSEDPPDLLPVLSSAERELEVLYGKLKAELNQLPQPTPF